MLSGMFEKQQVELVGGPADGRMIDVYSGSNSVVFATGNYVVRYKRRDESTFCIDKVLKKESCNQSPDA